MEIKKVRDGENLTVALSGRLDAVTSIALDKFLSKELIGVTNLTFDLANLEYIASAGLRILLKTQKRMETQGQMTVKNLQKLVSEVIEMSGFDLILHVEQEKSSSKNNFEFSAGGSFDEYEEFKL